MTKRERVLITGGAGFIGCHLARRLSAEGARVTVVDDLSRGRRDDDLMALAGVDLVEHDLTRPMPARLLPRRFDAVYHLAAAVGVEQAAREPARVLRTNLLATIHLLDWCLRHPPKTVFLSSTSEVADGAVQVGLCEFPVPEEVAFVLPEPTLPRSSYALSKMAAEAMLLHQSAFRVVAGRFHNVYGPRMGRSHVVPQMIERLLDGVDPFPVYGPRQTRAFCYVDDAVEAAVRLAQLQGGGHLTVNIGNDREEIEVLELAQRLFGLAERRPEVVAHDAPPGSPARRLPDLSVLRRHVRYEPRVDLDSGLARTFAWYEREREVTAGAGLVKEAMA